MSQAIKWLLDSLKSFVAYLKSTNIWRPRFSVAFWVSLLGLAAITILIWHFNLVGISSDKIILNLLYAILPLLLLFGTSQEEPESKWFKGMNYFLVGLVIFGLLLQFAARYERAYLGLNITSVFMSLPFLLAWILALKKPLLLVAMIPLTLMATVLAIFELFPEGSRLMYSLSPLPTILLTSSLWIVIASNLLNLTERWRKQRTKGPLMESVMMFFLFAPVIVLGILVAQLLSSSDTLPTIAGVLLSVIFGSVVSVPVRQFLLDLGDLPSVRREKVDVENG